MLGLRISNFAKNLIFETTTKDSGRGTPGGAPDAAEHPALRAEAAVGVACMFMGGDYLNYNALDPVLPGDMAYARYYGILLVEIGVGVTVMFSMIGIYIILASNGRFKRGL